MVRGIWKWRGEGWGQKSSRPGLSFVLGDQDLRQACRRRIIDHCGASTDIVINLSGCSVLAPACRRPTVLESIISLG